MASIIEVPYEVPSEASSAGACELVETVWGFCLGLVFSILLAAEEIKQTMFVCVSSSLSLRTIHNKTLYYAIEYDIWRIVH